MLFRLSEITKSYTAHDILRGASFQVNVNEKIGLVGRNGAGKTTIFRIITGEETADSGEIVTMNNLKIGLLQQHVDFTDSETVHTAALSAFKEIHDTEAEMRRLEKKMETDYSDEVLNAYAELQTEFERLEGFTYTAKAEAILLGLGFAKETWTLETKNLSGGQKKPARNGAAFVVRARRFYCSTNRPIISMSERSNGSKIFCRRMTVLTLSSATTAIFSTARPSALSKSKTDAPLITKEIIRIF